MILGQFENLTQEEFVQSLPRVASSLFNQYILVSDDNRYRLLEIEFYYKNTNHNDTYTHGHVRQLTSEEWYCHGSGLDITFGGEHFFGGILIRSLGLCKQISDPENPFEKVIIGPIKCLTEIFASFGKVQNANHIFYLHDNTVDKIIDLPPIADTDIIATPRIGLNLKTNPSMSQALYRFLIYPRYGHKNKQQIAEQWFKQLNYNKSELARIRKLMGGEFLRNFKINDFNQ